MLSVRVTSPAVRSLGRVNPRVLRWMMNLKVSRVDAHPIATDVVQVLVVSQRSKALLPDEPMGQHWLRPTAQVNLPIAIRPRA